MLLVTGLLTLNRVRITSPKTSLQANTGNFNFEEHEAGLPRSKEERNHLKRTKFTELSLKGAVMLTASVGTGDQLEHVCTHHIQHASGR